MISLENVSKRYGSKEIIHNISFDVNKGEIVGFLGPNGAGKTTTMRMIAGFTAATSGKVMIAGHDMADQNYEAAKKIGYLPEHPPLYDVLTVRSYLKFCAEAKHIAKAKIPSELDRVMQACQLDAVVNREVFKLSKGYRQRVGLAQAILGDPEVLLLDEPTAGLDPGQIQETREVIRSFGENHAVLLSTHILPEVTLICKRIAIINDGRILAVDSPESLQSAVAESNKVTITAIAGKDELKKTLLAIDGVTDATVSQPSQSTGVVKAVCHVTAEGRIESKIAKEIATRFELLGLEKEQPNLENVFLRYVGKN